MLDIKTHKGKINGPNQHYLGTVCFLPSLSLYKEKQFFESMFSQCKCFTLHMHVNFHSLSTKEHISVD